MIRYITDQEEKAEICERILRDLPEWFGIEASILDYIQAVKNQVMLAYDSVGFISLEESSLISMDIHVLGVLKKDHGKGIGKSLILAAEEYALEHGKAYITVKTLSSRHPDVNYKKTREFYEHMGYQALEEFPTLWGKGNPCLYMIKAFNGHILVVDDLIRLRRLDKSDYKMAFKWYSHPHILKYSENCEEPYNLDEIHKMYDYLNQIGELYIIEYFDEIWYPIGDVTLSNQTMPIVIDPIYKSKGIGKKVISYLLKRAKLLGIDKIALKGIYKFNTHSLNLFRSCGFVEKNRDELYVYMEIKL